MRRGEVWWAEPPGERPRPVVVLTRDRAIAAMERVLVAPLTTTVRGVPTEVPLGRRDGLPTACVVSLDDLAPIAKDYLVECITSLSADRTEEIGRALRRATGC
ncbi:MAG: type II toxin-antitoxin system PemK/MazF family toxin [Acidimicrobiales bacterium]